MKISLKLANGAALEFEGDSAEFERISDFLAEPPESLSAAPASTPEPEVTPNGGEALVTVGDDGKGNLEPAVVAAEIERVGARTDQERVTVMTQLAIDSGRDGIDYETLNYLYAELGLKKPAYFPTKTLSNAKYSGLLAMVKQGIWRTTYKGENFAKGHGRGGSTSRRPRPKGSVPSEGGEPN